ncbi:hypothetical protein Tco_1029825 [Tanacetum coccineum]|uniref:Uncharacterized protein n=1 Tax=Tanacetum coccineum TaxID=301880 RepID=A0ABQ5G4M7_9ASTR
MFSCELCGNDALYGYDCPTQVPFISNPDPCYNQNFDNNFPQTSPSFPQQYHCCENYKGPHESFQCQPMNQNYYEPNPSYNSNYSGFDQPPQYSIDHQEDLNQQKISNVHDRWDKIEESQNELLNMVQSFCEMVIQQKQAVNIDQSPPHEMSIQDMDDLKQHYLDEMLSIMSIEINKKKELWQLEQEANLSTYTTEPSRHFNFFYDDNDYEESIVPLNKIISQIPPSIAITRVLPIEDPKDSLSMGDEHLSTIPEKESDEFIKSSVEDLVPIPSESEDISDDECDLPFCDNYSPLDSDDESLPEEDVPDENFKIYSNPLFEFDDEFTSSDVNSLFNEVLEDIESEDSFVSKLDEPILLVTSLSDVNKDECFDPEGDIDEIKACLANDSIPPRIDEADVGNYI